MLSRPIQVGPTILFTRYCTKISFITQDNISSKRTAIYNDNNGGRGRMIGSREKKIYEFSVSFYTNKENNQLYCLQSGRTTKKCFYAGLIEYKLWEIGGTTIIFMTSVNSYWVSVFVVMPQLASYYEACNFILDLDSQWKPIVMCGRRSINRSDLKKNNN